MKRQLLLFVVNVDWFFLSHRLPVALAARDAGFDVHIATALTGPADAIERHGFTVHQIDVDRRSTNPLGALRLLWVLFRLMQRLRPSVVHLVTIKPVLLGGLAARVVRVPRVVAAISGLGFVFTARGLTAYVRRSMVAVIYRLALTGHGVRVIFQNDDDRVLLQRYTGIRDEKIVHIRGSGIDLLSWKVQPMPDAPPLVVMVARLLVDKGVCEFVEAARNLRGYRGTRFVLVGDIDQGNPTSFSRKQVQGWVNEGSIEWWGQRSDVSSILSMSHIVVLPSYREGLPKSLIEAAASGRAVVTTDVPGCRDAIEPGRTGLLVEVRNASALTQAIQSLLDDPARMKAMGEAGRRRAEQIFDVREVISRHLSLYCGDCSQ